MKLSRAIAILVAGLLLSAPADAADNDPVFAGVWSQKEGNGVGGMFLGQSWDDLSILRRASVSVKPAESLC